MNPRLFLTGLSKAVVISTLTLFALPSSAIEVQTSPSDTRQYEYLELDNRLKVLLVSDPETDKAAASLDVYAGSRDDPEGREGLAHFLEHMLFLGTEKYPEAGEYQAFISSHGGGHNAYTSFEHTNYFFDVDKDSLEPALDRFSQFFVAPLFTADYVAREKNAVHSEYQAKLKDDGRRAYSVFKQALNPQHPLANFSVGNLDTLADRENSQIRDELLAFYRRHYSANQMSLVILGSEPIAELRRWAIEKFSAVENRQIKRKQTPQDILATEQTPVRVNLIPLKEDRSLQMVFQLPAHQPHYQTKPASYLGHLLGHEGEGSLLSLLKARGWSDGLSAGLSMDTSSQSLFAVTVKLTREGLLHVDEIVAHCFQYLDLIRTQGIQPWVFEEQGKIADLQFRFLEKSSPINYVSALSSTLQKYPAEHVIRGAFMYEKYDADLIRQFLEPIRPENMLLMVMAQGLETDKKDPWYDTDYSISEISAELIQRWRNTSPDAALVLPLPNELIAEDLTVLPVEDKQLKPQRILDKPGLHLWHQQDDSFKLPKADFYFTLRSPAANSSLNNRVMTELLTQLVSDELNEYGYQAKLAGLNYSIYPHVRGIGVRISGFSDKQPVLLKKITASLRDPQFSDERFELIKEDMQRELENFPRSRPYHQAYAELSKLLLQPNWTEKQKLQALQAIDADSVRQFVPQLFEKLQIEALSHGNLTARSALGMADIVSQALLKTAQAVTVNDGSVVKLREGDRLLRDLAIDHPDSVYTLYLQAADRSLEQRATVALLAQILNAPFYSDLRTEKQLGYIVFSNPVSLLEVPGLMFLIQSPVADPGVMHEQVSAFLQAFRQQLDTMDSKSFEAHRQAVLTRLLEEDKNLQERTGRYWNDIDLQHYNFDSREQLAEVLRRLKLSDAQALYSQMILSDKSRRLLIESTGTKFSAQEKQADTTTQRITTASQLREGRGVYLRAEQITVADQQ